MKYSAHLLVIAFVFLISACLSDVEAPKNVPSVPEFKSEDLTRSAVTLIGSYTDNGAISEYGFEQGDANASNWVIISKNPPKDASGAFTYRVEGLSYGTTYNFRSYIASGEFKKYSTSKAVTTKSKSEAELSDVHFEQDVMHATIVDDGGRDITAVGFLGGESSDIADLQRNGKDIKGSMDEDGKSFTALIRSFDPGKTYYFIAYAENSDGGTRQFGYSRSTASVTVTEAFTVDIEDGVFAEYLIAHYDANHDGRMSYAELKEVTEISVNTDNIASLAGIERMPALKTLVCCGSAAGTGRLDRLDVSHNPALTTLRCDNNGIRSLNLTGNAQMDTLSCSGNRLAELSLLANKDLSWLDCGSNQISKLSDLSANKGLHHMDISGNPINLVDLSPCLDLREFNATSCPVLRIIYVWPDFMYDFDRSGFQKDASAEYVISPNAPIVFADARFKEYCVGQYDTSGDGEVSYTEAVMATRMDVCTDEIESMKGIAFFTGLKTLRCYGRDAATKAIVSYVGRLGSLDVSSLTSLDTLDCHGNQLTALDVAKNTGLRYLDCGGNKLTAVDFSHNLQLADLNCRQNQLANILLSSNAMLEHLNCEDNELIALDVSRNAYLTDLDCNSNKIPSLDISNNKELKHLSCAGNVLTTLDVSKNLKLEELDCSGNPLTEVTMYASQVIPSMTLPENAKVSYQINSITISPKVLTLQVEDSYTLEAAIDPADAIDKTVVWRSSDEAVATVSDAGVVTAVSVGTCDISGSCGGKTASCHVSVTPILVTEVRLDTTRVSLLIGGSYALLATVLPENASDKTVTWTSSDEAIATVSSEGVVSARRLGTCTITATAGEKTATCEVKVNPIPVSSVSLDKNELEIFIGDSETLTATVLPSNATYPEVTWSTSDESIATVSYDGVVTAVGVGSCMITATAGGERDQCAVTVNPIPVSSITLDPTSITLDVGGTHTIQAAVSPSNATDKTVTWSSDDTGVATVSGGIVRGVGLGTCTITASAGGKSATCRVEVQSNFIPVSSISLSQSSMTLIESGSGTLTANVLPSDASDPSVTWRSDNTAVATVSDGTVTAVAAGTCTITATAGEKSATCAITVKPSTIEVTSVSLSTTTLNLTVGNTSTLTATALPSDATDKTVTWTSDNTGVATVSSSGVVTAVGVGTCNITASAGGKSAKCAVTVTSGGGGPTVTSLSVSPTEYTLAVGGNTDLTATVVPSDATVTWSSDNESVAMVSQSGHVVALSDGSCKITASAGGKSASCNLTVIIPVDRIAVNPTTCVIPIKGTVTVTATVYPDNATFSNITWSSSDESIATVSQDGVIEGISMGSCTITVWAGGVSASCQVTVGSLPITSDFFPDDNFRAVLLHKSYDKNQDGDFSSEEIKAITSLYVYDRSIQSLAGIEYFTNLSTLTCGRNNLTELNLSANTNLTSLSCELNSLLSLDLSSCPSLTRLGCAGNQLTSLDLSSCSSLTSLECGSNQLTSLDLSSCSSLTSLICNHSQITSLDLNSCQSIEEVDCSYGSITSLDVSHHTALRRLDCKSNPFKSLDLSFCQSLEEVDCSHDQLTSLELESCSSLTTFNCSYNQLTSLNLSSCSSLTSLDCRHNQISYLDLSPCLSLLSLRCENNQLTYLDCSCPSLTSLRSQDNQLMSLDVSMCSSLTSLDCSYNKLTSLVLSPSLTSLSCYNNQLSSLDLSSCTLLTLIHCFNNVLTTLDVSNCTVLTRLWCYQNPYLTEIWLKTGQSISQLSYDSSVATIKYKE